MEKINDRSAIFISLVIVTIFWQLFYKQFYGELFERDILATTQRQETTYQTQYENDTKSYDAQYTSHTKKDKTTVSLQRQKQLIKEAETIAINRIKNLVLKCNGSFYLIDEYSYSYKDEISDIYKVSDFTTRSNNTYYRSQYHDYSLDRINHSTNIKDRITVNIFSKESVMKRGPKENPWVIKSNKSKLIASWNFTVVNNKLGNYPPTIISSQESIDKFFQYPFEVKKHRSSSIHKYSCNDIPYTNLKSTTQLK